MVKRSLKYGIIVIILLSVLSILAGCGSSNNSHVLIERDILSQVEHYAVRSVTTSDFTFRRVVNDNYRPIYRVEINRNVQTTLGDSNVFYVGFFFPQGGGGARNPSHVVRRCFFRDS